MRRGLMSVLAVITGMAILAGCDSSPGAQPHLGDKILIGINAELSGPIAPLGDAMVKAAQIAVNQVNDSGGLRGKQVELVAVDNGGSVGTAAALTTTLMTQHRVLTMIGPISNELFRATLSAADHQQVPVISPTACSAGILDTKPGSVSAYGFRTCLDDTQQAAAIGRFAAGELSASTATIFKLAEAQYATDFADAFSQAFTAADGTLAAEETFAAGETDFSRFSALLGTHPTDVVYVSGPATETGLIVRTLRESGFAAPILVVGGFSTGNMVTQAEPAVFSQVYYVSLFSRLDTGNSRMQQFVDAYQAAYGVEPDAVAALSYDAARLSMDAIERAGQPTGVAVGKAMAATINLEGASGRFSIGANHQVIADALVVGLVNGVPASVAHVPPA